MNTLFIDINNFADKNTLIQKIKRKALLSFGFSLNTDNEYMYLNFDLNFFNNQKNNLKIKIFKQYIKYKFKKYTGLNVITSKKVDEDIYFKKYIFALFDKITEINEQNTILENDITYIEEYITQNNINLSKFKILIVLNKFEDFNLNKINLYIQKYKFIDILCLKDMNKYDNLKIQKLLNDINNEFGSTIEMIKKRNVQEYNIHLIYSKITSEFYITNYTLKKHSKCIYFKDVDQDILNINYVAYEKYRIEILKVLRQMNIKKDNFSKNKLGALCKKVYDI